MWRSLLFAFLFLFYGSARAEETGEESSKLAPELAGLKASIDSWRLIGGLHSEVKWKSWILWSSVQRQIGTDAPPPVQSASDKLEFEAKVTFLAEGRKYRITQEYDRKMPGMSVDIAFDEKHFQFFSKRGSALHYGKSQDRSLLMAAKPIVQLQPFQYLPVKQFAGRTTFSAAPPDLLDDALISERLRKAVVGKIHTPAGDRPIVTFAGEKFDGEPVGCRVYVDGPDGLPAQMDYIDRRGKAVVTTTFEYSLPLGSRHWRLATGVATSCFDSDGKIASLSVATTEKLEVNPLIPDGAFSIDLTDANTVYDRDAQRFIKNDIPDKRQQLPAVTPVPDKAAPDAGGTPASSPRGGN